jgi:hypothetical protein
MLFHINLVSTIINKDILQDSKYLIRPLSFICIESIYIDYTQLEFREKRGK